MKLEDVSVMPYGDYGVKLYGHAIIASPEFIKELQDFTREKLAQHEFPRLVEFVAELPKTPAGKVHRKVLRDREAAAAAALVN